MGTEVHVEVDGRQLVLSNLEKVLYPAAGFTKAQVIDYYLRVAPTMLPHLAGRPPTLVRAPDGPDGERFFEKRCPPHRPDWVPTETVVSGGGHQGCIVGEVSALVWLANLAALELHTHQWTVADPYHPASVVIDLDPGAPATVLDCCRVALDLHDLLAQLDLAVVVKSSGGKGLHLSIPLNPDDRQTEPADDEAAKRFARALGQMLQQRDPKHVTVDMAKQQRTNRVFVDWSQNDLFKTTVCAYSLRIRDRPTVSAPVSWDEVSDALDAGDPGALTFETADVLARIDELGDLYEDTLTLQQELPSLT
jgi:bifunctional non-homologous end joining protein LigD